MSFTNKLLIHAASSFVLGAACAGIKHYLSKK